MRTGQIQRCWEVTVTYPLAPFDGIPHQNDGDGDGGFVCFICGRSTDRGKSFTCVSRRLETHEDSQGNPSVIDATASLQVCMPCTLLSAHHGLRWAIKPKLVEVEICGFYTYARWLADVVAQAKSDTRVQEELVRGLVTDANCFFSELDIPSILGGTHHGNPVSLITDGQCQRCHDAINSSQPYIAFEISIDIPERGGIRGSNIWRLGRYCKECSNQLLPLYSRL